MLNLLENFAKAVSTKVNPYIKHVKGFGQAQHRGFSDQAQQQVVNQPAGDCRPKQVQLGDAALDRLTPLVLQLEPEPVIVDLDQAKQRKSKSEPEIWSKGWDATYLRTKESFPWADEQLEYLATLVDPVQEPNAFKLLLHVCINIIERKYRNRSLTVPLPRTSFLNKFNFGMTATVLKERGILTCDDRYSKYWHRCKEYGLAPEVVDRLIELGCLERTARAFRRLPVTKIDRALTRKNIVFSEHLTAVNIDQLSALYDYNIWLVFEDKTLTLEQIKELLTRAALAKLHIQYLRSVCVLEAGAFVYYYAATTTPNGAQYRKYEVGYGIQNMPKEYRAQAMVGTGQINVDVEKCHVAISLWILEGLRGQLERLKEVRPEHIRLLTQQTDQLTEAIALLEAYKAGTIPEVPGMTLKQIKVAILAVINEASTSGRLSRETTLELEVRKARRWVGDEWKFSYKELCKLLRPITKAFAIVKHYYKHLNDRKSGMKAITQLLQCEEQAQLKELMKFASVNCHDGAILHEQDLALVMKVGDAVSFKLEEASYLTLTVKPIDTPHPHQEQINNIALSYQHERGAYPPPSNIFTYPTRWMGHILDNWIQAGGQLHHPTSP